MKKTKKPAKKTKAKTPAKAVKKLVKKVPAKKPVDDEDERQRQVDAEAAGLEAYFKKKFGFNNYVPNLTILKSLSKYVLYQLKDTFNTLYIFIKLFCSVIF